MLIIKLKMGKATTVIRCVITVHLIILGKHLAHNSSKLHHRVTHLGERVIFVFSLEVYFFKSHLNSCDTTVGVAFQWPF